MVIQCLIAVGVMVCLMVCFCTLILTFARALILKWIGVVLPGDQAHLPLLRDGEANVEEVGIKYVEDGNESGLVLVRKEGDEYVEVKGDEDGEEGNEIELDLLDEYWTRENLD